MAVTKEARTIVIVGAGGHGSELASYLHDLTARGDRLTLLGFADEGKSPGPWAGSRIIGDLSALKQEVQNSRYEEMFYITAVGDNLIRSHLVEKIEALEIPNLRPWTLEHRSALVGHGVKIGEGTCLAPGSIVTTNVTIGRHCIINVNASVSHDCVVEDFVNINPGAVVAGNVKLGRGCHIGAGATIIDGVTIGDRTVVGAGAVVVHDLPPCVTAVGVPARIVKRHAVDTKRTELRLAGEG